MPATIFSSASEVKSYGSNLSLNDVTKILSVSGNPASGAGTAAPVGSIALDYTNGKTYKKTGSLATEWAELGSGVGGINYIVNPDAESGTTGWSTYADAAGAQPVDGTGGSPSVTWTRSTTTPLRGTGDFNFVKDAANRQGQGVSYDVTVDNADLARVLTVSFDYEVVSGTYATGDLTVYLIQDPTGTPVVIQPAGYQVVSATSGTKMTQIATFQTDVAQKSYRLCFHVATTSASAYTLALDNIVLGPTQKVYGAPVTDWVSYTPTITTFSGTMTNYTARGRYRRVGDELEFTGEIEFTGAVGTWSSPFATIPAGLSIDTSKLPSSTPEQALGITTAVDPGNSDYALGKLRYSTPTQVLIWYAGTNTSDAGTLNDPSQGVPYSQSYPFSFASGDKIFWRGSVPILGWSSNVEVSSSTDTRVVSFRATRTTNQTGINPNNSSVKLQFDVVSSDSHGAYSTSNSRFVVPVSGYYEFSCSASLLGTNVVNNTYSVDFWINGGFYETADGKVPTAGNYTRINSKSSRIFLNAGNYVEAYLYGAGNNSVNTLTTDGASVWFSGNRLSGPSQIAASETVAIGATNASGQSIPNNSPTIVTNWTKDFDTHGAFNSTTGVFTAPIPGKYRITASIIYQTSGVAGDWRIEVYKNGTIQRANVINGTFTTFANPIVSFTSTVLAGDTIDVRANQFSAASRILNAAASYNFLYIERIGN